MGEVDYFVQCIGWRFPKIPMDTNMTIDVQVCPLFFSSSSQRKTAAYMDSFHPEIIKLA